MTDYISHHELSQSGILYVYSQRASIDMDPPYQRQSDVWPPNKRQLLIDSILNGFDIPKLYFHKLTGAAKGTSLRYSIVDGKQRLQSIWGFIDGDFALSDEIVFIEDPTVDLRGLTYDELAKKHPMIKMRFDGTKLPIEVIEVSDIELIEDMFSRLNEAMPLNAAEKRNAFGGPVPRLIRETANHAFFTRHLPFTNRRYRHYDLATKFLYLEDAGTLVDTKKAHLDEFVRKNKSKTSRQLQPIVTRCTATLGALAKVFTRKDALLKSVGSVTLYFWLYRDILKNNMRITAVPRRSLKLFEDLRDRNREAAEQELTAKFDLLEYDRLAQSPNDALALNYRYNTLVKYLKVPFDK